MAQKTDSVYSVKILVRLQHDTLACDSCALSHFLHIFSPPHACGFSLSFGPWSHTLLNLEF
jgi:hypothetical protein